MNTELQELIDSFLKILDLYSVINRKPVDYGTGDLLYFTEIHTLTVIGRNKEINITQLGEMMGVTKGAISQTVKKLAGKNLIVRANTSNKREVMLKLSDRGKIAYKGQKSLQKEIFTFAKKLYKKGTPKQREMVRRLFEEIIRNLMMRLENLEKAKVKTG
ncbi:MAG: MarR family transcriptional regulator [Bacteroidales bacterium]|nr:MarR family transcriptional regulator [Bacteroidales bacterium]